VIVRLSGLVIAVVLMAATLPSDAQLSENEHLPPPAGQPAGFVEGIVVLPAYETLGSACAGWLKAA
jgi:hypothetical protein